LWTSEVRLSFSRVPHGEVNHHEAFSFPRQDIIAQVTKCNCSALHGTVKKI
jgi:hypothetical protein